MNPEQRPQQNQGKDTETKSRDQSILEGEIDPIHGDDDDPDSEVIL